MKLYYVVNARMPSHKAYGIQIAKMCEAFIEQGVDLELIIPKSRQSRTSLKEFYNLRVDVPTHIGMNLDWYDKGSAGYIVSSTTFTLSALLYLVRRRKSGIIYTIDMDQFYFAPLALLGIPVAIEMHSVKPVNVSTKFFFSRARHIITTNALIKENLVGAFNIKEERIMVEPNGVDQTAFHTPPKDEARKRLGLPETEKIVLYVGRFYDWKGMDVLQKAAADLQKQGILTYLVGGLKEEFEKATKGSSDHLHFGGSVAHKDVALWCAASDALLILGTHASEFSYRYTAPMKLFEYLAAGRPVIAADTPAMRSLISEHEVAFYVPDDVDDLRRKILESISDVERSKRMSVAGLEKARGHTWAKRAGRILAFMQPGNA